MQKHDAIAAKISVLLGNLGRSRQNHCWPPQSNKAKIIAVLSQPFCDLKF
jgi:hypothetical protein